MFELQTPPDYFGQFMAPLQKSQELGMQQQQINMQQQQAQLQQQQLQRQLAEQQAYSADAASVISNPTPDGYRALMLKYPQMHESLKGAWDQYSTEKQDSDVADAGQVYSALSNGRTDLALQLLQNRKTAQTSAGHDDPLTDKMLDMVNSGDPAQIKQAQGIAGFALATTAGPDKIGPMLDALSGGQYTLGAEETRFDRNGNPVAQSPYVKTNNGILVRDGSGGGAPSAPAAVGNPSTAIAHVLGNEGGYNPKDANGYPTNFGINFKANTGILKSMGITAANFKDMTKEQAEQIYASKYWPQSGAADLPANLQAPYFDAYIRSPSGAKRLLSEAGGDPVKFAQLSQNFFAKLAQQPKYAPYTKAWANRDAGNLALASGATTPTADGSPPAAPAGYHWLVPPEADKAKIPTGYQPDLAHPGRIQPIPGGPQDMGSDTALTQYGIAPNETGPAVLAKLPANVASQVKGLAEGRLPMPSSFALAKPYWQTMLQLTAQYDPSFDAANAAARKAAITAFTGNGKAAQTIGSVNRVANHLDLLWNESQRLTGPDAGFGPLNTALATVGQSFQPADAKAYDNEVQFVGGELEKIARNSPGTVTGVDKIVSTLGRQNSLSTRNAAIKAAVGIISGAVDPLKDQYNSAFTNDSTRPNIPWVSPRAQQIYKRIAGVDTNLTGANAGTNSSNSGAKNPPPGATKTATGPNGQKVALINGHWVSY